MNPVGSYDFLHHRTEDGRAFRRLNVRDEFSRESLAIRVRRKLSSSDVVDVLSDRFLLRGVPGHIRSDHGPEFVAKVVRRWIAAVGARTAFLRPGSPWENGFIESFHARLRDELRNGEIFHTLKAFNRTRLTRVCTENHNTLYMQPYLESGEPKIPSLMAYDDIFR